MKIFEEDLNTVPKIYLDVNGVLSVTLVLPHFTHVVGRPGEPRIYIGVVLSLQTLYIIMLK